MFGHLTGYFFRHIIQEERRRIEDKRGRRRRKRSYLDQLRKRNITDRTRSSRLRRLTEMVRDYSIDKSLASNLERERW